MTTEVFLNSLIEIAKSDLLASKLLFINGFYMQSTFYLQQGVEKANIAFVIFNGVIKTDEIKNLGHDHIELHKKAINFQLDKVKMLNNNSIETKDFLDTISSHTNIDHMGYIKSFGRF